MGRCKDGGNWRFQAASVSHILYLFGPEILFLWEKKLGGFEKYLWQPCSILLG